MHTFEHKEYSLLIVAEAIDSGIKMSTELDFIKYESEPQTFDFGRWRKLHDRIGYTLDIERTYIKITYADIDFDFKLEFVLKKEDMDTLKETLTKIKKSAADLHALKKEVAAIQKNMHFGLTPINKKIQFVASKKNIYMRGDPELIDKFSELMMLMNLTIYPDHNQSQQCNWQDKYNDFKHLLKSAYDIFYIFNRQKQCHNVLYDVALFVKSVQYFRCFETSNNENQTHLVEFAYKTIAEKKPDTVVLEIVINYFPEYEIHKHKTTEDKQKYTEYKTNNFIKIGTAERGYAIEQQSYVYDSQMILWNPKAYN